jgi:hypothetical protein
MGAPSYDHSAVYIDLRDPRGNITLGSLHSGLLLTGATGSGKSSSLAKLLMTTFLTSCRAVKGGMGGVVLFAKPGESKDWIAACKRAWRKRDIVHITPGSSYGFNFLDWIASWSAKEARGPLAIVDFLLEIGSAVDGGQGNSGGDDNAFFVSAHRTQLLNLVLLCQLAGLRVSLPLMRALAISLPRSAAEERDPAWRAQSACWHALCEAEALTRGDPSAAADYAECRSYFLKDFPGLSEKTRGVIDTMLTNLIQPFLLRPLRSLFCESTNIKPEDCFKGKVILVDIPVQEHGIVGKLAALVFKRAFQLAIMRRHGPPGSLRPAFLFADEAQLFLTPKDAEYQCVARSGGGITVYITQNYSNIREALGSDERAESLASNLIVKVFCQNTGHTNEWASRLIGERYLQITGINVGRGGGTKDGMIGDASSHAGISRSEQKRAWIEPAAFQKLRRGGKANGYLVDAVVFIGGQVFEGRNGPQPYKLMSFSQR